MNRKIINIDQQDHAIHQLPLRNGNDLSFRRNDKGMQIHPATQTKGVARGLFGPLPAGGFFICFRA
ncbi:MAG: hypothetical protein R3C97_00810 [Geminicoccaceae bacterium]